MSSVLIIEDEPAIQTVLSTLMRFLTPNVFQATTLAEARSTLRYAGKLDLILLDLGLPDGSGLDLLQELKTEGTLGNTPVLVITANGLEEDHRKSVSLGAREVITKPFSAISLKSKAASFLA